MPEESGKKKTFVERMCDLLEGEGKPKELDLMNDYHLMYVVSKMTLEQRKDLCLAVATIYAFPGSSEGIISGMMASGMAKYGAEIGRKMKEKKEKEK